ncbi:MAG: hypothetical protein IH924_02545 [Proteobacteria bacterium]|nr:hypothetical protein [Pseudomonadota bacterium]
MTTTYYVAFWNLENLFDIETAPLARRPEKLAKKIKKEIKGWTQAILDKKLARLAEIIGKMNANQGPDILGVCEVENKHVMDLLKAGASLVANDIDTLTPALRGFAAALEEAVSGKAQSNLYCSWRERQAFDTHFDTHDVYAMHVAGEKLWRLYETRTDTPIAHNLFKSYGQKWHDKNKGAVAEEILMRPGDLLYIPRGRYHDALATSDGALHVSFGLTHVIGVDVMSMLSNIAVADPAFRANMPRPEEGEDAIGAWLSDLGDRLAKHAAHKESLEATMSWLVLLSIPSVNFTSLFRLDEPLPRV